MVVVGHCAAVPVIERSYPDSRLCYMGTVVVSSCIDAVATMMGVQAA